MFPPETPKPKLPGFAELSIPEQLLDGTREFTGREWVFRSIDDWLCKSERRSFLLVGQPGSGKSSIAAHLVRMSRGEIPAAGFARVGQGVVSYAHFCRALEIGTLDPLRFIEALAHRIAALSPAYVRALAALGEEKVEIFGSAVAQMAAPGVRVIGVNVEQLNVGERSAEVAFERLVRAPLARLAPSERLDREVVILVDGLDEALSFRSQESIVTVLRGLLAVEFPLSLRLLLTSRPDEGIVRELGDPSLDLEADAPADVDDVREYAYRRLTRIAEQERLLVAGEVAKASGGNFLYARYVLDELAQEAELDPSTLTLPNGLKGQYQRFLDRERSRNEVRWRECSQPLLRLLAVARSPGLTRKHLVGAADLRLSEADDALQSLSPFLIGQQPEGPFRFYHQSFRDFLFDTAIPDFHVHSGEANEDVARFLLAEYGDDWLVSDEVRSLARQSELRYALEHLPAHFIEASHGAVTRARRRALVAELAALLGRLDFLEAKTSLFGIDATLTDFTSARDLLPAGQGPAEDILRVLDREAHHLRGWDASEEPALFAQQVYHRAAAFSISALAKAAATRLEQLAAPSLELRWLAASESPALERVLAAHDNDILAIAVTRDGRAVSASNDKTLRVWDLDSGRELHTLIGHEGPVTAVAITPDGRAVSASSDETLRVWDLERGRELRAIVWSGTLPGSDRGLAFDRVRLDALVVTPSGRAVCALTDRTLRVWDLEQGRELHSLAGHEGHVWGLAVTRAGRVVSVAEDETLRVWDVEQGRELQTVVWSGTLPVRDFGPMGRFREKFLAIAVTPDGRAVCASSDGTLRVWDLEQGRELQTLAGHEDAVRAVVVAGDGRVVSGALDGTVRVWDLEHGHELHTLRGHGRGVQALAAAPKGRIVSASQERTLYVWNLGRWREHDALGHEDGIWRIAVTRDGRAISASADNTLRVWDLEDGRRLHTLIGHDDDVTAVAVTADGRAVSASHDGTLRVWDLDGGRELHTLVGHTSLIELLAVTRDRRVVSASFDRTLRVWDLECGRELHAIPSAESDVRGLAVTPDGGRAASAHDDGTLRVYDLNHGRVVHNLTGHRGPVWGLAVTPDGRAVSASEDATLRVWDLERGRELQMLIGHAGAVRAVAIAPDGHAVSASDDATLRVWEPDHGREIRTLTGHQGGVVGLVIAADGRAFSASRDGTLRVWDLNRPRNRQEAAIRLDPPISAFCPTPGGIIVGDSSGGIFSLVFRRARQVERVREAHAPAK